MLEQVWTTHFLFYGNKQIIHTTSKQPEEWDTKRMNHICLLLEVCCSGLFWKETPPSLGGNFNVLWSQTNINSML